jgi:hypothetical protein
MCVRRAPSPHNARSPGGRQTTRARSQEERLRTPDTDTTPLDFQAAKLRRVYLFCYATARTVAALAFGGLPR